MPVAVLRESHLFDREILSLTQYLLNPGKTGIIAEFKRKSPSKGIINEEADVLKTTIEYTSYGASGLSILTDEFFFGGSSGDLVKARVNPLPILRKDFIIDEYQVIESRAIGADALLLIAACLQPRQVKGFAALAKDIGMEVLLEIHEESELEHICDDIDLVGINSRDLKSFAVDTDASLQLLGKTPPGRPVIAESGINSVESVVT